MNVKTDTQPTAQLATNFVVHRHKCTIQKTVGQFDVINHLDKAGHANKRVDFMAVIHPGYLDFEFPVDLFGCVLQRFHRCCNYREPARSVGIIIDSECKDINFFEKPKVFF